MSFEYGFENSLEIFEFFDRLSFVVDILSLLSLIGLKFFNCIFEWDSCFVDKFGI